MSVAAFAARKVAKGCSWAFVFVCFVHPLNSLETWTMVLDGRFVVVVVMIVVVIVVVLVVMIVEMVGGQSRGNVLERESTRDVATLLSAS